MQMNSSMAPLGFRETENSKLKLSKNLKGKRVFSHCFWCVNHVKPERGPKNSALNGQSISNKAITA